MKRRTFIKLATTGAALYYGSGVIAANNLLAQDSVQLKVWSADKGAFIMTDEIIRSEQEWRKILTPEQFEVTREEGTERAFSGAYDKHYAKGIYQCIGCGQDLFDSQHKYDSGTGWPSFYQPIAAENIGISKDRKWLMVRNEVHCSRCKSHLGHVFEDGPKPTGLRYCMNSVALQFVPT